MSAISLKNVWKIHPGVTAVADLSLDINDGEFVALVGPSGCGKTTTLRMIAGFESISQGSICIDGRDCTGLPPVERGLSYVFQNYALFPHMNVRENIAFGLYPLDASSKEAADKVASIAATLGISHLLDSSPSQLSGGQRQRVALGRALVSGKRLVLLDEPLSNLDVVLRSTMRSEFVHLHKKLGSTFILVTHSQEETMAMADRIVVMRDGFVEQVGTPREVYENPRNLFVATFMSFPCNKIAAKIAADGSAVCVMIGNVKVALPHSESLLRHIGREVWAVVRPSDITIGEHGVIPATVNLCQYYGARENFRRHARWREAADNSLPVMAAQGGRESKPRH